MFTHSAIDRMNKEQKENSHENPGDPETKEAHTKTSKTIFL